MTEDRTKKIDDLLYTGRITSEDADRQQKLSEACRYALRDFIGRTMTPTLVAEAEGYLRQTFEELSRSGVYVVPVGLAVDYVKLGNDMRIKVFFKRVEPIL